MAELWQLGHNRPCRPTLARRLAAYPDRRRFHDTQGVFRRIGHGVKAARRLAILPIALAILGVATIRNAH
jgi:hypothetical protein